MSRAFTAAMEALQSEQQAHITSLRQHASRLMESGDLPADHPAVVDHLAAIDLQEERHRELLSAIALLHSLESETA